VQATLTATADNLTSTATIFVHQKVTAISITPSSTGGCVSSGGTQNFTAQALNNGTDITQSVGPFTWSSTVASVVSIDNNGLATAQSPGTASIVASAGGTTNSATFNTCAVKTINLHVTGAPDTSFSMTFPSTTQQALTADVIDANGKSISANGISFSVVPAHLGASGSGSFNPLMGGSGAIVASCQPPSCNIGLNYDTFSNPVVANVSGTVSGSVWVASTAGTALVAIAPSTNTAGTPIKLPASPNSLIVGSNGSNAYLGSSSGLMVVNLSTNAVTTVSGAPGKILAVDPLENHAIVANSTNVFVVTISGSQVQTLNVAGATAAAWTPDGFNAYIVAGSSVSELVPQSSTQPFNVKQFNLSSPASDVTFLTSGRFAYFAQSSGVTARRPCDNLQADLVPTSGPAQNVKAATNDATAFAVDSNGSATGVDVISPTISSGTGCGQAVTDTTKFRTFNSGLFTPTDLITTPDSNWLFVTGAANLLAYNVSADQTSSIMLAGSAMPLSGDALLDSSSLYIGANDGNVHQLKIANGAVTDAAQIAVSSAIGGNPDLVAFLQR
jgi:hypothetical protein